MQPMPRIQSEFRSISYDGQEYIVRMHQIIGTRMLVHTAWKLADMRICSHQCITHFEGDCYGQVGSERLPKEIAALPSGDQRVAQVRAFRNERARLAQIVILTAFADLRGSALPGQYEVVTNLAV